MNCANMFKYLYYKYKRPWETRSVDKILYEVGDNRACRGNRGGSFQPWESKYRKRGYDNDLKYVRKRKAWWEEETKEHEYGEEKFMANRD